MVFWLLFSNESIQNILILSATVAPFASAGIRPVVNRLNQDTTVYYGRVFCLFSWPYMVKGHNSGIIIRVDASARKRGSEWEYTSITLNTSFFNWLCNTKHLNFRHFNTNSKKFFKTVYFFPEGSKNGSKKANIILFSISRSFRPFYDNSGLFQKISEGYRRFPKSVKDFRSLTKRSDHCRRCPKNPPNTITKSIFFGNSKH